MFMVNEAEAAAIRAVYERGGELSATAELCRLFPGLTGTLRARECARIIAGWLPAGELASVRERLASQQKRGTKSKAVKLSQ